MAPFILLHPLWNVMVPDIVKMPYECQLICTSNDKCDAYKIVEGTCFTYEGITEFAEDSSSNFYTPFEYHSQELKPRVSITSTTVSSTSEPKPETTTTTYVEIVPPAPCPPAGIGSFTESPEGSKRYIWPVRLVIGLNWKNANLKCKEKDVRGNIASIFSYSDIEFTQEKTYPGLELWIGLNDSDHEEQNGFGQWTWLDGRKVTNDFPLIITYHNDTDTEENDFAFARNIDGDKFEVVFADETYKLLNAACELRCP